VITEFADDESNTVSETRLRLHVGGSSTRGGASGVHWHTNANNEIDYIAVDEKRQSIPYVRLTDRLTGAVKEFSVGGTHDAALSGGELRRMDCVDCHNRPTHGFSMTPERAVNEALADGRVPADLPYLRREAVAAPQAEYGSQSEAAAAIEHTLRDFYGRQYPDLVSSRQADVERAIAGVQRLYARNVFPLMGVTWGTHRNNLGHTDAPGCFRCHDGQHSTASGEVIPQDCDLCHDFE
jgi:hypothetical protein